MKTLLLPIVNKKVHLISLNDTRTINVNYANSLLIESFHINQLLMDKQ